MHWVKPAKGWLILRWVWVLAIVTQPAMADTINVAVAANFTAAAKEIATAYHQETGDTVNLSFGSTGKLYAQIINGAPFAIFLAADQARPQKLIAAGKADAEQHFTYAQGQLVLWRPEPQALPVTQNGIPELSHFQRIAIANPKTAPYGAAAVEALNKMNMYDAVKAKLVQGDSISQTFQFVRSGNAQAGFIAASQVALVAQGSTWSVPKSYYSPIAQDAVLLNSAHDQPAALAFMRYLRSEKAKQVINKYGYIIP